MDAALAQQRLAAFLTASDTDLGRVASATADLDDFVRSITAKHCN
jgi:hypothetical protein